MSGETINIIFELFNNDTYDYDFKLAFDSPSCIIIPIVLTSHKFKTFKRKPLWTFPKIEYDDTQVNISRKNFLSKYSFGHKPINNYIPNTGTSNDEIIGICYINVLHYNIFSFEFDGNILRITTMEKQEVDNPLTTESLSLIRRSINKQDLINYGVGLYNQPLKHAIIQFCYYERKTFGEQIKCYILPQRIIFEYNDDDNTAHIIYLQDLRKIYPGLTYIITYNGYKSIPNKHGVKSIIINNTPSTSRNGYQYTPEEVYTTPDDIENTGPDLTDTDIQYLAHEYIPELHKNDNV